MSILNIEKSALCEPGLVAALRNIEVHEAFSALKSVIDIMGDRAPVALHQAFNKLEDAIQKSKQNSDDVLVSLGLSDMVSEKIDIHDFNALMTLDMYNRSEKISDLMVMEDFSDAITRFVPDFDFDKHKHRTLKSVVPMIEDAVAVRRTMQSKPMVAM